MKINVLRHLVIPWILFFGSTVAGIVVAGVVFHLPAREHPTAQGFVLIGIVLCVYSNLVTLSKAGIWIANSVPSYLSRNPWGWFVRAGLALGVAYLFYIFGQISWIPLAWQAFVIPTVFAICLFIMVWSLMGPILMWSSKVAFCRAVAWILSLPVFAIVPITAVFVGQTILTAYISSRPEPIVLEIKKAPVKVAEVKKNGSHSSAAIVAALDKAEKKSAEPVVDPKVEVLKTAVESGQPCYDLSKQIQQAMEPKNSEDLAYWGTRAVKCSDLKSVVALPKLLKLVHDHSSPMVRAAAIRAMPKWGMDEMKKVTYLLFKRVGENEPAEVVEATSQVLAKLGETEAKTVTKRLTALLDSQRLGEVAARLLVNDMKRTDLVVDYVAANLVLNNVARDRAVNLVCLLPAEQHVMIESHMDQVVASLKTGDENDPAKKALDCLGHSGLQAIKQEVIKPQQLDRKLAAHTLAEMNIKEDPEMLATADDCARDQNPQVRKWCSQSLGKLGVTALPKIMDLLKSSDPDLKESGQQALGNIDDPLARPELEKIRAENSGWMANQRKLQIARAVDSALVKMKAEEIAHPTTK